MFYLDVSVDKYATFYGISDSFFTSFCVDNGKVVGFGAGKGSGNVILFETVA